MEHILHCDNISELLVPKLYMYYEKLLTSIDPTEEYNKIILINGYVNKMAANHLNLQL